MVRRTKEEAQETRNSILDAAERVFFEKGVSRTSLADIAQAAGVTRGAIYWHFAHKSDLVYRNVSTACCCRWTNSRPPRKTPMSPTRSGA